MDFLKEIQNKYITKMFEGCELGKSKFLPNSIVWRKDKHILCELNVFRDNKTFTFYHKVWDELCTMFSIKIYDVEDILSEWIKNSIHKELLNIERYYDSTYKCSIDLKDAFHFIHLLDNELTNVSLKEKHLTIKIETTF